LHARDSIVKEQAVSREESVIQAWTREVDLHVGCTATLGPTGVEIVEAVLGGSEHSLLLNIAVGAIVVNDLLLINPEE